MLSNIINKYTNHFSQHTKKHSLIQLFNILSYPNKSEVDINELLGGVLALTKDSDDKLIKINLINSDIGSAILTGMLKLYVNSELVPDVSILSEAIIYEMNSTNLRLEEFISKQSSCENGNFEQSSINEGSIEENEKYSEEELIGKLISFVNTSFETSQSKLNSELMKMNILEITEIIEKYSMLGQINKAQMMLAIEEIFSKSQVKFKEYNEKKEQISSFLSILNINNNYELFDITQMHSALIIFFKGSVEDKVQSIFKICDNEGQMMSFVEIFNFFKNVLSFLSNHLQIEDKVIDSIARTLLEEIYTNFNLNTEKDKINAKNLTEFYYKISNSE
jgi:hypothetical protein